MFRINAMHRMLETGQPVDCPSGLPRPRGNNIEGFSENPAVIPLVSPQLRAHAWEDGIGFAIKQNEY
jgi:hypothetical protein